MNRLGLDRAMTAIWRSCGPHEIFEEHGIWYALLTLRGRKRWAGITAKEARSSFERIALAGVSTRWSELAEDYFESGVKPCALTPDQQTALDECGAIGLDAATRMPPWQVVCHPIVLRWLREIRQEGWRMGASLGDVWVNGRRLYGDDMRAAIQAMVGLGWLEAHKGTKDSTVERCAQSQYRATPLLRDLLARSP